MAIAKWMSLAWFFAPLLSLAGLHWTNEKSKTREVPLDTSSKPSALGMVLAFLEATEMCLHGQCLWKLQCFSLTDNGEILFLGKTSC